MKDLDFNMENFPYCLLVNLKTVTDEKILNIKMNSDDLEHPSWKLPFKPFWGLRAMKGSTLSSIAKTSNDP